MNKFIATIALSLSSATAATPTPSRLEGVVIMNCVTTLKGQIVGKDAFKIDFANKMVNNRPVDLIVDDVSINWNERANDAYDRAGARRYPYDFSISRINGELQKARYIAIPLAVSNCQITQNRRF